MNSFESSGVNKKQTIFFCTLENGCEEKHKSSESIAVVFYPINTILRYPIHSIY